MLPMHINRNVNADYAKVNTTNANFTTFINLIFLKTALNGN